MYELRKLNVHRIVTTESEKAKLLAEGYEELSREDFLKEFEPKKAVRKGKE